MNPAQNHNDPTLPLDARQRIDTLCDQFEEQLESGAAPRIEEFLERHADLPTRELLLELLAVELQVEGKRWQASKLDSYRRRFTHDLEAVELAFQLATDRSHEDPTELARSSDPASVTHSMHGSADTQRNRGPRPTPKTEQRSDTFGEYQILEEIARGGMGVVYRAHHTKLNRTVALKMIKSEGWVDSSQIARFHIEAKAAAKLDHPGIVPVYDVGEMDGQHYYSMAFIHGQDLSERVKREGPLTPLESARLVKAAAEAVHHAHQADVIHRDLKPANLLLDQQGQVRVTDFGLAKIQSGVEHTAAGQVLGTPAYMPPEQAAGTQDQVSVAADVYSLGATLYYLLVGRAPFQTADIVDTLRQVIDEDPVPPRRLNPAIPMDLETICLKCLNKPVEQRYASAQALADDLDNWLEGRPIVARRVGRIEKVIKWCRRKPVIAGLILAMILMVSIGSLVFWERQKAIRAQGWVDSLSNASTSQVKAIKAEIGKLRFWTDSRLRSAYASAEAGSDARLHLGMVLLAQDAEARVEIEERLLEVSPLQFKHVRDSLRDHVTTDFLDALWSKALSEETHDTIRFQAACALATYDPQNHNWQETEVQTWVANHLLGVRPSELLPWTDALRPVKQDLIGALTELYRNPSAEAQVRSFASDTLADYLSGDADRLFELLAQATEQQYFPVFDQLLTHRDRALELGRREVRRPIPADATEAEKEAMAIRKANVAVMLLRMDTPDPVWPLLKHSADPRARSYIIHWLSPRGGEAKTLIERYEQESDITIKRALLLCLGEFELAGADQESLLETLLHVYRVDPDPGLRAAAEWLLRQWGQAEALTLIDKGLRQSEGQLIAAQDNQQQWYVNTQGQTFVILDADEFRMGSSASEVGHQPNEISHRRRPGRRIAIATKEVTRSQWRSFYNATSVWPPDQTQVTRYSRTDDSPMIGMNWYQAAHYCNWLSEQEGIPEDQWCYEKNAEGEYGPGMKAKEKFWERTGYRLPTEAEWEYACRAGTNSSRYYGVSETLLPQYAWYLANSDDHPHPVASLKPNDFGLFDMHGNVQEWCYDTYQDYSSGLDWGDQLGLLAGTRVLADSPLTGAVEETGEHVLRGGTFSFTPLSVRSALRYFQQANGISVNAGFRPARTYHTFP